MTSAGCGFRFGVSDSSSIEIVARGNLESKLCADTLAARVPMDVGILANFLERGLGLEQCSGPRREQFYKLMKINRRRILLEHRRVPLPVKPSSGCKRYRNQRARLQLWFHRPPPHNADADAGFDHLDYGFGQLHPRRLLWPDSRRV